MRPTFEIYGVSHYKTGIKVGEAYWSPAKRFSSETPCFVLAIKGKDRVEFVTKRQMVKHALEKGWLVHA